MEDFKNLKVWVKAHELTLAVYRKTLTFPREEMYGLTSQLRVRPPRLERTLLKDAAAGQMEK